MACATADCYKDDENNDDNDSHDVRLVDSSDTVTAVLLGVVESVASHSLRSLERNELNGLDDAIDDLMLDTRVLSLCVLTDQDSVDVVVRGLVAFDGSAWSNVGEEVKGSSEGQVQGHVSLSNWSCQRT